jgi:hypothetical protein
MRVDGLADVDVAGVPRMSFGGWSYPDAALIGGVAEVAAGPAKSACAAPSPQVQLTRRMPH